ncbi:hypothetical protein ACFLXD_06230 [Chloroflexota bacterium]
MSSENPEIIHKYQKIAEKYVVNRLIRQDEKRHDRISSSEAQAIKMAYKEGLSDLKIAALFKRDPRSISKVLPSGRKGLLDLVILQAGRRVVDFKTSKYARLIKFRIGNTRSNMILVENIRLEVLDSKKHDFGPRIEGLIQPYKYDVELQIGKDVEYVITEDNFKLAKNDFDDFEVLCTSQPGTIYTVVIIVDHSEYPKIETRIQRSEAFKLAFPKGEESTNVELGGQFKLIAANTSDYLTYLSDYIKNLSKVDRIELRIYLENPLSDDLVQAMENELTEHGAILCSPLLQDARIVRIIFSSNEALPVAIGNIKLPTLLGWQIFDAAGNCLRGMRKFDDNVAVVEEKP